MTIAAALLATVLFLAVAGVQVGLLLGAPLGGIVMGGRNPGRLPGRLRASAGIAALILVIASLIVLARSGAISWSPLPVDLLGPATWVVAGFMVLSTLANFASKSMFERSAFGGATALLAVLSAFVALTGTGPVTPQ